VIEHGESQRWKKLKDEAGRGAPIGMVAACPVEVTSKTGKT
jgi:hypothetical protein